MEPVFTEIRKQFGFGFMRLPMTGEKVDIPQTMQMVDTFLENGFNYFDTAHGYIGGQSELALSTAGQLVSSALIDRFGLFGMPVTRIRRQQLPGYALVLLGVILVVLN